MKTFVVLQTVSVRYSSRDWAERSSVVCLHFEVSLKLLGRVQGAHRDHSNDVEAGAADASWISGALVKPSQDNKSVLLVGASEATRAAKRMIGRLALKSLLF